MGGDAGDVDGGMEVGGDGLGYCGAGREGGAAGPGIGDDGWVGRRGDDGDGDVDAAGGGAGYAPWSPQSMLWN